MLNEEKKVRIAGIRALRYFLQDEEKIDAFLGLHVDMLLCRCIDIVLDNQVERVHALKLVRRILNVSPSKMTMALTRCIVSLANGEPSTQEKLIRACLCIISELGKPPIFLSAFTLLFFDSKYFMLYEDIFVELRINNELTDKYTRNN